MVRAQHTLKIVKQTLFALSGARGFANSVVFTGEFGNELLSRKAARGFVALKLQHRVVKVEFVLNLNPLQQSLK